MTQQTDEISENSFGTRFKTALKNLGIGTVFIIAGSFLLWHNESEILDRDLRISQAESVLSDQQGTDSSQEPDLQATTTFNWSLRVCSWIILFMGLATLFKPMVVLVEKIPVLTNFVGRGITVFSLFSSLSLMLILMSAVWMVARPVFGAVLLLVGLISLIILYRSGKRARLKHILKQL